MYRCNHSYPTPLTPPLHRIATINHREIDSDEEQGEAYYQGGSERSGQQILGPPGRKKDNQDLVGRMFKSAKELVTILAPHPCLPLSTPLHPFLTLLCQLASYATPLHNMYN